MAHKIGHCPAPGKAPLPIALTGPIVLSPQPNGQSGQFRDFQNRTMRQRGRTVSRDVRLVDAAELPYESHHALMLLTASRWSVRLRGMEMDP
jgi:hypothetical protein